MLKPRILVEASKCQTWDIHYLISRSTWLYARSLSLRIEELQLEGCDNFRHCFDSISKDPPILQVQIWNTRKLWGACNTCNKSQDLLSNLYERVIRTMRILITNSILITAKFLIWIFEESIFQEIFIIIL